MNSIGISAMPGLWANHYDCKEDNIIETINYMLDLHASDFPNTCCVGITVKYGDIVKIYPKVKNKLFTIDFYTGEKKYESMG